jgi:hypothetical protein
VRAENACFRGRSSHVVAIIEILSPALKDGRNAIRMFVEKAADIRNQGVDLLVVDLFPPTPRDPQEIYKAMRSPQRSRDGGSGSGDGFHRDVAESLQRGVVVERALQPYSITAARCREWTLTNIWVNGS